MEHGLPQNWIEAVAQTPDGMLWVATSTGLARLEGEAFVRIDASVDGERPLANVKRLFSDPTGRLWAETFSEVFYSDDGQEFRRAPGSPQSHHPKGSTTDQFLLDSEGFIHRLTPEGPVLLRTESEAPARGLQRVVVHGQVLYTGADQGVQRYALQSSGFDVRELPLLPTGSPVIDLLVNQQGGLWVGLSEGVFRRENDQWIRILEGLSSPEFLGDREGSLWISTNGEGLWQVLPSATFEVDLEGLPDPVVWTVTLSPEGELWVGTGQGLARLTDQGFQTIPETLGLTIHSLTFDTSNTLWIGSPRGLFRWRLAGPDPGVLEPVPLTSTEPQPPIRGAMEPTPAGDLWIGTSQGLFHLVTGAIDGRVETIRQITGPGTDSPKPQRIRDLELDTLGRLWIVSESEGFWRLDSDQLTQTALEGLDSETIGLWFAPDGAPWMTTRSRGVLRVNGEQWVAVTREHGLFDDNVHQMIPDGLGWVWMTSNRGVFKVRYDDLQRVADGHSRQLESVSYGTEDGLLNVECNSGHPGAILLPDGHLMVPTMDGLASVDPARPRHNPVPPRLTITAMQANYRPVDLRGELQLGPDQRNVSIDYAASTYVMPSKTRYRYRLDSVDTDWIDAGDRRTAFYTDLEPGNYTFRVHAANADGVWSLDEATLRFEVLPLWHERGGVRTMLGVLAGALLAGLGWILGRRVHLRDSRTQPEGAAPTAVIDPPVRSTELDGPSASDGPGESDGSGEPNDSGEPDGSDDAPVVSPKYPLVAAEPVDMKSLDEVFLRRVSEAIEDRLNDSNFGVFELAEAVHLSRRQLHRKLVAMVGENPAALLRRIRLERAKKLLLGGAGSVAEVARAVGYTKPGHFSERFKQTYGMNPSELLQGSKEPPRDGTLES